MSSGFLAWAVAAVLSIHGQSEDVSWEISAGGTGTSLVGWSDSGRLGPIRIDCNGTPPVFELLFFLPREVRRGDIEAFRIPPGQVRQIRQEGEHVTLSREELEFLAESGAVVEMEIRAPDEEAIWYSSPESVTFATALNKFLEYCAHNFPSARRKFEVDGIEVELQIEVDEKGIEDIRALAGEFGIRDIQKIFIGQWGIPSSSLAAIVESRQVRDGDTVAHRMLKVTHKYWEYWEPSEQESEEEVINRGFWRARPRDLHILDRWTIRDGDWSIEVRLGEGVPYDDAVRIIHAFRAGTLVDVRQGPPEMHLAAPTEPYEFKDWSVEHPPGIRRDESGSELRRYEISIPSSGGGSGRALQLRIVGDRVEVLGVSIWNV